MKWVRIVVGVIAVAVAVALLAVCWRWLMVHLSEFTGTSSSASRAYNYWSGWGSVIPWSLAVLGALFAAGRHLNCVNRGCWRITRHTVEDPDTHVKYRKCHVHHPLIPDEHSRHGILRNHMSDEHSESLHERVRKLNVGDPREIP